MDKCQHLVGTSAAIQELQEELECAARSDAKVLITGESGVGKEVVARLIHHESRRSHCPLVTINCAGVPDTLLESEMFGHTRGSFTDAYRDKRGLLELATGGTVFMDEVGEMSPRMQALLLRFLENGEIQRVGSDRSRATVDVRVISATNRNLADRIAAREFREDLYYRLNVIHVAIPPLRGHREDIPALLRHFSQFYADLHHVRLPDISPEAMAQLVGYDWPGNVRELKNVAERLIVRSRSQVLGPADLPAEIPGRVQPAPPRQEPPVAMRDAHAAMFDRMVEQGESFWTVVYGPFMARDITRNDIRAIVGKGLERTQGSYKTLVQLLSMEPGDYKRFLAFLHKYDCHVPFQRFRTLPARLSRQDSAERAAS